VKLLASLSVDLDEIHHYTGIHGAVHLGESLARHAVYDIAIDRFASFASERKLPLTFFAVGADLSRPENARRASDLVRRGHEVSNHSLDHRYDLTRQSLEVLREQVLHGAAAIEAVTGAAPQGFRAPGYTLDDRLVRVLEEAGVRYDSSVFPCPAYYVSKLAVLGAQRLLGRRSTSIPSSPGVLASPQRPYRLGTPYYQRGAGLLELPIQVTRKLRLPYIGTALMLAGPTRARWLTRGVLGEPFVNLELHGIDLLDREDGLSDLARYQPDLRVSRRTKLDILATVVHDLASAGYEFVTLEQAASALA
jgi:hypothetical protein